MLNKGALTPKYPPWLRHCNLVTNSPAALKHLSASTENGGRVLDNFQFFEHNETQTLCGQHVEWCMDAQCTLTQVLLLCSSLMLASPDVF